MVTSKKQRRWHVVLLPAGVGLFLVLSLAWQLTLVTAQSSTSGLWEPQGKISLGNLADNANFGMSVAIDGNTAVIGAPRDGDVGAVYVYERSGAAWNRQVVLTVTSGAANDFFGWDVALTGDTAVIGAYGENGEQGAVYVFIRNGTVWSQQARLTADDGAAGDAFGISVAISGNTLLVGAHNRAENGSGSGAVYVFTRNGTMWSQQSKLLPDDGAAGNNFGSAVSVWGDTAVIGAPYHDGGGNDSGAAYIFIRDGNTWTQQTRFFANDIAAGSAFGWDVALRGDTAVIGAWGADGNRGAAYVFTGNGAAWSQQGKLIANDRASGDLLGTSVALAENILVVGAPHGRGVISATGAAYIFYQDGGGWSQQDKLTAADGAANDRFGQAVGVSEFTAVAGAPLDDDDGDNSGTAYLFALPVYTLTVDISGNGRIDLNPPGSQGQGSHSFSSLYITGTVVTLTAVADTAWYFTGWNGDCSGLNNCVVTLDAPTNVTATFSTRNMFLPLITQP